MNKKFAVIDSSNLVTEILVFDVETENEGIALTRNVIGDQTATVVETFINADGTSATRYNYGGKGFTWDSANNAFIPLRPYTSWSLNDSFDWVAPVPVPPEGYTPDGDLIEQFWKEAPLRWEGLVFPNDDCTYYWNTATNVWTLI
tara:strand:+ start:1548 stop:1982 length:435 start_codon:yes stop_codon:yes gene_type:complete